MSGLSDHILHITERNYRMFARENRDEYGHEVSSQFDHKSHNWTWRLEHCASGTLFTNQQESDMANGAKVSKVEVEIGGKTISLTLAQVKELRDALNGLFGEKVVERHVHHYRDWWRRPYTYLSSGWSSVPGCRLESKREALCLSVQ